LRNRVAQLLSRPSKALEHFVILTDSAIFLAAAVVAVPIFKRIGLGSVLGYLAAGALIGPSVLGIVHDVDEILHFAEFGVVLLLFLIGLELQPSRLWNMRAMVFGAGGAQVLLTTLILTGVGLALGFDWRVSSVAAVALSLSSTAFVLQLLGEKRELSTGHGRVSLAVLLFQDIAAIPVLALIPLLAVGAAAAGDAEGSVWISIARVVGVMAGLIVAGRFLLRPLLQFIASAKSHELSTASALLVVIGTAILMQSVGLSAALGAFMAGVLLADSEYRHELEANIEPFKGLLLGLFFMAVGMSANAQVVIQQPLVVLAGALGLTAVKFGVLFGISKVLKLNPYEGSSLGIALAQGGEFAFVIFTVARGAGVLPQSVVEVLVVVVTLSMVFTPLLFVARDELVKRLGKRGPQREFDEIHNEGSRVIVAGFGRFGQIVARLLGAKKMTFTALEVSPAQIDFVRKFGSRIYFGDASRIDLLRAAGAEKAEVFVLAIDDVETSLRTVRVVRENFPHLRIIARARNRQHMYSLLGLGVETVIRETFLSSIEAGRVTLEALGIDPERAAADAQKFATYDEVRVRQMFAVRDDEKALIAGAKQYALELEELFEADEQRAPLQAGNN
jgi:monovalent cation:proton antiporter-2 (CPA2) family protein